MRFLCVMAMGVMLGLLGCSQQPTCSVADGDFGAASAGCLVVNEGDLLLVRIMGGKFGPPGGSVDSGESAQCAAERETWEETGVHAVAGELAAEFDNGFNLYWCTSTSGRGLDITRPIEIHHADWYAPEIFTQLNWRYANQGDMVADLMAARQK